MEKDFKIAQEIINGDVRRKKFFLDKLKGDLRKNSLIISDDKLEELFMEVCKMYTLEEKNMFYYFCLRKIRTSLEEEYGNKYVSNEFFSRSEYVIITKYLDNSNGFTNSFEIANLLGVSAIDVNNTIFKLKNYLATNKNQILELFPNAIKLLKEREAKGTKKQKTNAITEDIIEIIGYYTGQIDDICLDFDEIAKKFSTTPRVIEYRIRGFINSLNNKKNYNYLISKYPEVEKMLVLKTKALGLNPENIFLKKKKHETSKKTSYEKQKKVLATTLSENKENNLEKKADEYIKALKMIYAEKEDGSYYKIQEIGNLTGIKNFSGKKIYILKQLDNNEKLRNIILSKYSDLYEDMEIFKVIKDIKHGKKNTLDDKYSLSIARKYSEFFKSIFCSQYKSFDEASVDLGTTSKCLMARINKMLTIVDNEKNVRREFKLIIPNYLEIIEDFKKTSLEYEKDKRKESILPELAVQYAEFLRLVYGSQDMFSPQTISRMLKKLNFNNLLAAKIVINNELRFNEDLYSEVLKLYPEYLEDRKNYENRVQNANNKFSVQMDALKNGDEGNYEFKLKVLKLIFQEDADIGYRDFEEIGRMLKVSGAYVSVLKRNILKELENNLEFSNYIEKNYSELENDIQKYNSYGGHLGLKKIRNFAKILKDVYTPLDNGKYRKIGSICKDYNLTVSGCNNLKNRALNYFENDIIIRNKIIELYPTILDDMKEYNDLKIQKRNFSNQKVAKHIKLIEFLRATYKKKENGFYRSNEEICQELNIAYSTIFLYRKQALEILNDINNPLREKILAEYPDVLQDISIFNEISNSSKFHKDNKDGDANKAKRLALCLRAIYKKDENGLYRNIRTVKEMIGFSHSTIFNYKKEALEILNDIDNPLRNDILEEYPEVLNDILEFDNYKKEKREKKNFNNSKEKKAKKIVDFLKTVYSKDEFGNFHSVDVVCNLLGLNSKNYFTIKMKRIATALEDDVLKQLVISEYPEVLVDAENFERESSVVLTAKEQQFADSQLRDVTRDFLTNGEISRRLNIQETNFNFLENRTFQKINASNTLKSKYPTAVKENTIRRNIPRKKQVILMSEEELNNIRENSRKLDLPGQTIDDSKHCLIEGIKRLENSIYKDFVCLCTYEQKAILALKLGFFNKKIFSTADICELFLVSSDYVTYLTDECLKNVSNASKKIKIKQKNS